METLKIKCSNLLKLDRKILDAALYHNAEEIKYYSHHRERLYNSIMNYIKTARITFKHIYDEQALYKLCDGDFDVKNMIEDVVFASFRRYPND